ncbi:MAG: hypothetical protein ACOCQR_02265 [bacterium]
MSERKYTDEQFGSQIRGLIEDKIIKEFGQRDWVKDGYGATKIDIPEDTLYEIYRSIDMENVKEMIREKIEKEMADKIVNKFATEIATDIKELMSQKNVRQELRFIIRSKIKELDENIMSDE